MIFLPVGTWYRGYDRLVKAVDALIADGTIDDEVIAQIGCGSYIPKNMKVIKFCSPQDFREFINKARFVVSHAGMGTIIEVINQNKAVVVLPRKASLGEVDNDHQFTTSKRLEAEGKVLVAYEVGELPAKLEQAKTFVPTIGKNSESICSAVKEFIENVVAKKHLSKTMKSKGLTVRFWPYRILKKDDDEIRADLDNIMRHFATLGQVFDMVVFVPYAGEYLKELYVEKFGSSFDIVFVTVRRASTVSKEGIVKRFIFKRKRLSDLFRHLDVLLRLIKYKIGIRQKMVAELEIDFDVEDKRVLIIDDDIATGTTLSLVKSSLLDRGASSVTTATISNHFLPDKINVDYSVYRYVLLRTKNSRDYYAT